MAPFVSCSGALLCAAVTFSSHSICSTLMRSLPYKHCKTTFREKWFGDGNTLNYTRALVLGSVCGIFLSQSGTLNIKSFSFCVGRFVHLVCGYVCICVLEGICFSRWHSRRHRCTFQRSPPFLQCSYQQPSFFQALSGILVILVLHFAPLAVWAEQVPWTRSYPPLCASPPEQLSASAGKTAFSFSFSIITWFPAVLGSIHSADDLHENCPYFCVDKGSRSRPAAARTIGNPCFKCVKTLVRRKLAPNVVGSCNLLLSQKSTASRPCYISSYCYRKKDRLPTTCFRPNTCQRLKSQPLLQTRAPPSCIFFCFPPGRLSPAGAVTGGSTCFRYPNYLCTLQSTVGVARSSWYATSVPAIRPSCVLCHTNVNARGGLPYEWFLNWRAVYTHDERRLPVAFRTPHKSTVTCCATAESRAHALLEQIKKLTIVEVSELVNLIEQSFGVPAARAAPAYLAEDSRSQGGETEREDGAAQSKAEKKTAFSVEIKSVPLEKRIVVIKTLRTVRPDLGLKDAKGVIDALPNTILNNVSKEKAEEAQKILADAGAQVEIK